MVHQVIWYTSWLFPPLLLNQYIAIIESNRVIIEGRMVPDINTVKELYWILRLIDETKSSCMGSLCISVRWNYLPESHCVTRIWLSWNHYISLHQATRRTIPHLLFNTSICWFSEWITNIILAQQSFMQCLSNVRRKSLMACIMLWCIMCYAVVYYVLCCGVIMKILKIDNVYQHIWIWIWWFLQAIVRMLKYIRSQIIAGITRGRVLQEDLYTRTI